MTCRPLLLLCCVLLLAACKKDDTPRASAGARCPDTTLTGAAAFVCRLYAEFPYEDDSGEDEPVPSFLSYFAEEFRDTLREVPSRTVVLYRNGFNAEHAKDLRFAWNPTKGIVTLKFTGPNDSKESLELSVVARDSLWRITDMRYEPAAGKKSYTLRESLRPHKAQPLPAEGAYGPARRRFLDLVWILNSYQALLFSADKRAALLSEIDDVLVPFLQAGIAKALDLPEIPGAETGTKNLLLACLHVEVLCYDDIDGVTIDFPQEGFEGVATTRAFLRDHFGGALHSEGGKLDVAGIYETLMGGIHGSDTWTGVDLSLPDGLDSASSVIMSYHGEETVYGNPPGALAMVAFKDSHAFVIGSKTKIPRIKVCDDRFQAVLASRDVTCAEHGCYAQTDEQRAVYEDAQALFQSCYLKEWESTPHHAEMMRDAKTVLDRLAAAR